MSTHTKNLYSAHNARSRSIVPGTLVPMIDVVFLLLVFFLLVSNFRGPEGFLPTDLPTQAGFNSAMELEPIHIYLHSQPDGSCHVQIDNEQGFVILPDNGDRNFSPLSDKMQMILKRQKRRTDDPVKLIPTWNTQWDHVVKAYDALWKINLTNIIFAAVGNP